jgi:ABC-type lipoprotein release transport system permease subunit
MKPMFPTREILRHNITMQVHEKTKEITTMKTMHVFKNVIM